MFSSLGQALGWARQRGIGEEGQAITQRAGQCCGRHICEQGQNGQQGVAGALRQSRTLREDDHPPNEVAFDKEKAFFVHWRESVHKEVETGVCSVCWKLQWVQQAKSGMWRLKK